MVCHFDFDKKNMLNSFIKIHDFVLYIECELQVSHWMKKFDFE